MRPHAPPDPAGVAMHGAVVLTNLAREAAAVADPAEILPGIERLRTETRAAIAGAGGVSVARRD